MIIPHANLGQIGVVGDQNGQALPLMPWTDSMNVRFTPLGVEKIAESTLRIPKTLISRYSLLRCVTVRCTSLPQATTGCTCMTATSGFSRLLVSDDAVWHFTHWGDTVIFNCPEHPPQMFNWDTLKTGQTQRQQRFIDAA